MGFLKKKKSTILFITATTCLGISLTKEGKDPYNENPQMLLKEITENTE